jgi:hypothetical protein
MKRLSALTVVCIMGLFCSGTVAGEPPLFDMESTRDAGTLEVEVLQDWHRVAGPVPTRQKHVTINVGEIWPGQDYRVPVRMIVPVDRAPDGSPDYLGRLIPDENSAEMTRDTKRNAWIVEIRLDPHASRIDFFTNHRKTIRFREKSYATYLSCPYTRVTY